MRGNIEESESYHYGAKTPVLSDTYCGNPINMRRICDAFASQFLDVPLGNPYQILCEDFIYPKDFDDEKFNLFLSLSRIAFDGPKENLLYSLDVAKERDKHFCFNNAGVLFFAKDPQKFIRESYLSCVRYQGTDRSQIIDRQEIYGCPITLIEDTLKFVKRNIKLSTIVTGEAQHKEVYEYPLPALREAITNAVMHRDYYYDISHVYIHIFSNRLEVENPGGLPPGLKVEDIENRSVRRNRTIADLLFRARFIERVGSGIQRIKRTLEENNNPPAEILASNYFVIKFHPRIDVEGALQITKRQNQLYQFIREKSLVTKSEVTNLLNVSGDTALRELKVLISKGLIEKHGTGKSTRYELV